MIKLNNDDKKIVILGSSGSGKSTLAKNLGEKYKIPVFYYDQIRWLENWQEPKKEYVLKQLDDISKKDSYIIEGTYSSKLKDIISKSDKIIVLEIPTYICTYRILKRTFLSFITLKNGARDDLPKGCNEKLGLGYLRFIRYTLTYNKILKIMYKELEDSKDKIVIINKNIKL
jgi:adenylate kinase family enzyme